MLKQRVELVKERYEQGTALEDDYVKALNEYLNARIEMAYGKGERVVLYERLVDNLRQLEDLAATKHEVGRSTIDDVLAARDARIRAEIVLLREQEAR